MKKLYIFSTSLNPDVFINAIVHCANAEIFSTKRVEIVTVFESSAEEERKAKNYSSIRKNIEQVLEDLAAGVYKYVGTDGQEIKIKISEDDREYYKKARRNLEGVLFTRILYENLETEFDRRLAENTFSNDDPPACVFDVSGERKYFMTDLLFISLKKGFRDIYVFDIIKPINFKEPVKNLIHSLNAEDYKFKNLFESQYVAQSLSSFENPAKLNRVLDFSSSIFAKQILMAILLVSMGLLYWIIKLMPFFQEHWEAIEPISFLFYTLGGVITTFKIGLIFVILWERKFALNPFSIFEGLKSVMRKWLNKKFDF
ncbi:MAG: hypothetical protein AAFR61_23900 [Bacteroidota bacterium]